MLGVGKTVGKGTWVGEGTAVDGSTVTGSWVGEVALTEGPIVGEMPAGACVEGTEVEGGNVDGGNVDGVSVDGSTDIAKGVGATVVGMLVGAKVPVLGAAPCTTNGELGATACSLSWSFPSSNALSISGAYLDATAVVVSSVTARSNRPNTV